MAHATAAAPLNEKVSPSQTDAPDPREEPDAIRVVPAWKPVSQWVGVGIFLFLTVAAFAYASAFLTPVVLAFLLTLVFSPVRRFLDRVGLPSGFSALLIVGSLLAALVVGVLLLASPISGWIEDAPTIGRQIEEKVRSLRGSVEAVAEVGAKVDELASGNAIAVDEPGPDTVEDEVQEVVVQDQAMTTKLALVAPAALAQVMFTLVLLFFLLASGDMFYEKIVHVMPTLKDKRRAIKIAYDIERKLSRYLSTITLINAGLGVSIGLAMWLLGMPNPLLFAVIGFVFNFIPYIGALAGVAIATIVGFISFDEVSRAFLAGAVYFSLTTIEGQLVTPYFVGRSLKLNTVVVFLSVTFWAWLWSVVGMLIAVPVLVTIRTFCEHVPALENLGDFLSARHVEEENEEEKASEAT